MNNKYRIFISALSVSLAMLLGATSAQALEVWLQAQSYTKALPANAAGTATQNVTMWGYSLCGANFSACGAPSSPGPTIVVPVGDPTLTIRLRNGLPTDLNEFVPNETSFLVPGLRKSLAPARFTSGPFDGRIRSFDTETAAGADGTYTFANIQPGTYLYHSGTHPQVQVQMGLYGAIVKNAGANLAYPGVPFDTEQVLVFSEVDPALHEAVDPVAGTGTTYGTASGPTSTVRYAPKFFRINDQPFTDASAYAAGGIFSRITATAGQRKLLRLVNAGIENHAPQLVNGYFSIVAEDSVLAPVVRSQYNTLLPAGKRLDVLFTPAQAGTYVMYDRRLRTVNPAPVTGPAAPPPPVLVTVPNVVGATQAAATTAINNAGLVVGTVGSQPGGTAGNVFSQSPAGGASVAAGSAVNLVVYAGAAPATVPNVVGLTQAAATTAINNAGLVVGTVGSQPGGTAGNVFSQSPVGGTSVAAGSAVNLVVYAGAAPVSVPNVVGLTQAAATTAINNAGLVVGTVGSQPGGTAGNVFSQSPVGGTSVAAGSAVNLVVYAGTGPTNVIFINAGGPTIGAHLSDRNFTGGTAYTFGNQTGVYNTERWSTGSFSYAIPVPAGPVQVTLRLRESCVPCAYTRRFSVVAEGTTVLSNITVAPNTVGDQTFLVTSDATLNLTFISNQGEAWVNAIEVQVP